MTMHDTGGIPAGLADRLRHLAEAGTSGSTPWPAVDQSLRRAGRRRALPVVAAILVAVTIGTGAILSRTAPVRDERPAVAGLSAAAPAGQRRAATAAGLAGAVGGSLRQDATWIEGLRQQVVTLGAGRPQEPASAADVVVLWAGDLPGRRFAIVTTAATPDRAGPGIWTTSTLLGRPGAAPAQMQRTSQSSGPITGSLLSQPVTEPITVSGSDPARSLVFVTAPKASIAELATHRRFSPTGTVTTQWRPLQKQGGAIWVGAANQEELGIAKVRTDGSDRDVTTLLVPPHYDLPPLLALAPKANQETLKWILMALDPAGLSSAEVPVFVGTSTARDDAVTAVVFRSPDHGYITGFQATVTTVSGDRSTVPLYVISRQPFTDDASFMTAVDTPDAGDGTRVDYAVVAPQGATAVRIGTVTVPVQQRVAVVDLPRPGRISASTYDASYPRRTVEALDAAGNVIGTVQSQPMPAG